MSKDLDQLVKELGYLRLERDHYRQLCIDYGEAIVDWYQEADGWEQSLADIAHKILGPKYYD